nr:1475_t:CDS:1 [Entrophospora candida]
MEQTQMNSIIKLLLKRVLAEKPGPKRQILCELLIEELSQVVNIPREDTHEDAVTIKENKGKEKQLAVEENDPKEGSSSNNQLNLIIKRAQVETNFDPLTKWEPITFLKYKDQQLPCKCNKAWLKQKAQEHFDWVRPTRKMNYHCCNCGRPTAKSDTHDGWKWDCYQLCNSCFKSRSYDITEESWYNQPCKVCDQPMTERVNISWNNDVCSEVCKYAYLAVTSANTFTHVPQKVRHYIEVKNCSENEEEVLKAAEAYYIKLNGPVDEEEYHQRYYTNETWQEAWERLELEYEQLGHRMDTYLQENEEDEEYIRTLNQAYVENREAIMEKLPKLLNLKEHPRHTTDKINLCHECLLPFNEEDLATVGKKLLCKFIKVQNEEPCYKDLEEEARQKIVEDYLKRRNKEYSKKFIIYLNKNKEKTKNAWMPYTCEKCETPVTLSQVRQVVKRVSCEKCYLDWGEQLYEKEKENGTLEERRKLQTGGSGARLRRDQRRQGRQL